MEIISKTYGNLLSINWVAMVCLWSHSSGHKAGHKTRQRHTTEIDQSGLVWIVWNVCDELWIGFKWSKFIWVGL